MASRVRVFVVVVAAVVAASLLPTIVECRVHRYKFDVVMQNVTRLCTTKSIVTVNGMFPGPTIYAREDDNLVVEVVNNVHYNVTIHWHGIRQIRTGWADGPAYVTQCPIQPGQSYVYNYTVTGQRGTLLWHAHILWLRATVHGAMVILPKLDVPYPFPAPNKEVIIMLGEWWNSDVEAVIDEALASGLSPNVSDAHTINGYPGPMSQCASQDGGGYKLKVKSGNKYLLRIVNAALNEELFFRVSGHSLTVVETDGIYTKPFVTDTILVGPGQTTNAILSADASPGRYAITASTFLDTPIPVDKAPATAVIRYTPTPTTTTTATLDPPPAVNATPVASAFIDSLRSLNSVDYPARVPKEVDHSLLFTVGVGVNPCETCPGGFRVVADINNVTFVMPKVGILEAHYYGMKGVFTDDFPGRPPRRYDYTGMNNTEMPLGEMRTTTGTRVYRVKYNQTVEVVLQGTSVVAPENHPFHLHGFNFFAVARGMGNFDEVESRKSFNLVDPIERNTIGVPSAGWVAIRFRADNPGVWFMHCHLEIHTTWGLKMAFLVDNGDGPDQSLLPPPSDLPTC